MNNNEIVNIKGLCNINLRRYRNFFLGALIFVLAVFLFNLILISLNAFVPSDGLKYQLVSTYGTIALPLSILFTLTTTFQYKKNYVEDEIFPQNNSSRLLSNIIINFIFLFTFLLIGIILYLFTLLILSIMNKYTGNLIFAYDKSWLFLFTGFIVNFLYGSMIAAVIILIGVLDRRFNILFRIGASVTAILILIFSSFGVTILKYIESFYRNEAYVSLFILKASLTTIFLLLLSLFISKHTPTLEAPMKKYKKPLMVSLVVLLVVFSITMFSLLLRKTVDYYKTGYLKEVTDFFLKDGFDSLNHYDELNIDISTINKEEPLRIFKGENILSNHFDFTHTYAPSLVKNKDTLLIKYALPENYINGVDTFKLLNAKLTYTLEGNDLTIDYEYDKNKVVLLVSPYDNMASFKLFSDKAYCNPIKGGMSSTGSTTVEIFNGKGVEIIENSIK